MKRKKAGIAAGIFFVILLLSGCNSSTLAIMDRDGTKGESAYRSSFYWSGFTESSVHIKDEDARDVVFDVDMKKGNLTCKLENKDGVVLYTLTKDDAYTGKEQFTFDETGDYKLVVKGKGFSGSYKITWGIKGEEETTAAGQPEGTTTAAGETTAAGQPTGMTTAAVGETTAAGQPGGMTTAAVGETTAAGQPGGMTTAAVGETTAAGQPEGTTTAAGGVK